MYFEKNDTSRNNIFINVQNVVFSLDYKLDMLVSVINDGMKNMAGKNIYWKLFSTKWN